MIVQLVLDVAVQGSPSQVPPTLRTNLNCRASSNSQSAFSLQLATHLPAALHKNTHQTLRMPPLSESCRKPTRVSFTSRWKVLHEKRVFRQRQKGRRRNRKEQPQPPSAVLSAHCAVEKSEPSRNINHRLIIQSH